MKEELYYPWYIEKAGILKIIISWLILSITVIGLSFTYSKYGLISVIVILLLTIILATNYLFLIKEKLKTAREQALSHTINLEKREFMKAIHPFIPDDQKHIANKIIKLKDYSTEEYAKVTLSSKSRILFNTEAFIKQIEAMFSDSEKQYTIPQANDDYDDYKFKVPEKAKKKYEQLQNQSAFNDTLQVSEKTKQAIVNKAYQAMHHAALGREILDINKS